MPRYSDNFHCVWYRPGSPINDLISKRKNGGNFFPGKRPYRRGSGKRPDLTPFLWHLSLSVFLRCVPWLKYLLSFASLFTLPNIFYMQRLLVCVLIAPPMIHHDPTLRHLFKIFTQPKKHQCHNTRSKSPLLVKRSKQLRAHSLLVLKARWFWKIRTDIFIHVLQYSEIWPSPGVNLYQHYQHHWKYFFEEISFECFSWVESCQPAAGEKVKGRPCLCLSSQLTANSTSVHFVLFVFYENSFLNLPGSPLSRVPFSGCHCQCKCVFCQIV